MATRSINPKEEFNKHRKILLSNIPPSTEGEIKEFLGSFKAKKVTINDSLDSALVTFINGNQVDEAVEKLNNKQFKDNIVSVRPALNANLVSIAHIPLTYTDNNFRDFCSKYGQVEYSYIVRAAGNGLSKGYGLVEFTADSEHVKQIKSEIDWHSLDGQTLHADFVLESYQTWEGLQSRCLLITNMPEDFVDVSKLRETFSCVTSPVYCQIIAKGDKSLGFGIVEFRTSENAEQTWIKLKNEKINGKLVTMTFCIPGKSAVVINNRIMWKYGDKLPKPTSRLPDPVSVKPVISGNPIVISLTKHNPKLMEDFTCVLGELQQAYLSQMMSPENKPDGSCTFKTGLLGPAPSLPLSPVMNPNMQLGLLVMLALHIQATKKEQFTGVLAKQLNILSEQEGIENQRLGPKPSILGEALTGQANVILTSLKQQLNQVPLTGDNGKQLQEPKTQDEKIRLLVKKFVTNGRYLNLGLLSNLGQLLVNMKHSDVTSHDSGNRGQSLLGPMPAGSSQPLMNTPLGKGASLLGDPPAAVAQPLQSASIANANINSSIMQAMGLNVGSGSSMGNMGQTLLSQISQGLVHQIGQNILYQMTVSQTGHNEPGRGLLGDVPKENSQKSKRTSAANKSLLGEGPLKSGQVSKNTNTAMDQGSWKGAESRRRMEMTSDNKNQQMDRWGSAAYDNSGYGSKGGMETSGNEYGYGNEAYGDMSGGGGQYAGGGGGQYAGYGDVSSDYYNYQSQYGYGGQTDNSYQTESSYNNQFGSGYGMGGSEGITSNAGYGMNTGYEGNQSSGVNYQDGQVYGKGDNSGLGQDSGKYGSDGYGGNMSGTGYGYGERNDSGNGYESYDVSGGYNSNVGNRMGTGGVGNSDMGSTDGMGSGGMSGAGYMGSGAMGMGVGGMGSGGMGSGGMGSGGMGSGGMGSGGMGSGGMGSGGMGSGGMGSGGMGSGGMSGGGFMGSGAMGMGAGGMGGMGVGGGGMDGGTMNSGAMGGSYMESGGMDGGGMMGGYMGSGGMGGGGMGSGGMGGGGMGSGGVDSGDMGSGGYMGSGGMSDGFMGSGSMGNGYMGSGGMGNRVSESGSMGSSNMGAAFMGGGGIDSSTMGNVGGGFMGSGGMGRDQKTNSSMGNSMMGGGGMDGSMMMGTGGMGLLDNSVGGGSGGMRGGGNMGGERLGSGGMGNSSNSASMMSMADNYSNVGALGGTSRSSMGGGGGGQLGNTGGNNFGGGGQLGNIGGSNFGGGGQLGNTGGSNFGGGGQLGNTGGSNFGGGGQLGNTGGSNFVGGGQLSNTGGSNFVGSMSSGSGSMGGSLGQTSSRENSVFYTGIGGKSSTAGRLKYMPTPGQKRDLSQLMAQSDMNGPNSSNFMGRQSQGHEGHYTDTLKKNRLF